MIAAGDAGRLQTIPGVGKRFAERIVVECRDAAALLAAQSVPTAPAAAGATTPALEEAVSALVNLGYRRPDAERAVQRVAHDGEPLEEIIRAALRGLSG